MIKHSVGNTQAELLQKLPLFLVTAVDGADRVWASALFGAPGFVHVHAEDPSLVCISNARLLDNGKV